MFCGVAVAAVVQVGGEALLVARALVVVPEPPEGLDRLGAARRPRHRRTRSCPRSRPRPPAHARNTRPGRGADAAAGLAATRRSTASLRPPAHQPRTHPTADEDGSGSAWIVALPVPLGLSHAGGRRREGRTHRSDSLAPGMGRSATQAHPDRVRSPGWKAASMIARLAGVISAPPIPCTARAAMSQPMLAAAAHTTAARGNQPTPARNTRPRPPRPLTEPA